MTNRQERYDQSVIEYDKGKEAFEAGDYQNALDHLYNSLELWENCKTHYYISKALTAFNRENEAYVEMQAAHKSNPNHSQIATAYAEMLNDKGEIQKAVDVLKSVIDHNSTYNPAKRLLCKILDS